LHLLATSFTTGKLCSFSSEGFWTYDKSCPVLHRNELIPLALAVASSSAFPPFFPPTAITRKMLDASNEEFPYDPEFLTDGGVFDNLGFAKFYQLSQSDDCQIDHLILSDAGAQLDWDLKGRFARIIARTIRSTDILMQRVADFTLSDLSSVGAKAYHLSIANEILPGEDKNPLPINFQKKLPRIRTDLNRFSALEIEFLLKHGEDVAGSHLKSLAESGDQPDEAEAGSTTRLSSAELPKLARRLDSARLRTLGLFYVWDWLSFALFGYLLAIIALAALPYAYVAQRAVEGNLFPRSVQLSFATDRKPNSLSQSPDDLQESLYTGLATVGVPANHQVGLLERPGGGLFDFRSDPTKYFAVGSIYTSPRPTAALNNSSSNEALVYIHGFNTTFDYALMKTAQIALDMQFDGLVISYSWGSEGKASAYQQDRRAASVSVPHFADYLSLLRRASIGPISIIAEGMGGIVLLDGVKHLMETNSDFSAGKSGRRIFGQLIFFVPDVDVHQFASALRNVAPLAERTTIFVAPNSDIMQEANSIAPGVRAGSDPAPFTSIPDVEAILLKELSGYPSFQIINALAGILRRNQIPWDASLRRATGDAKLWEMITSTRAR
jgi:esterase/lipase superfamily enzyme